MLTVYGEVAAGPPQMELQPVALEIIHVIAEQLSYEASIAGFCTACAGAGELEVRLLELAADNGVVS